MTRRLNGQGTKPVRRGKGWTATVWLTDALTGERERVRVSAKTQTLLAAKIEQRRREAEEGFIGSKLDGDQSVETYSKRWLDVHLPERDLTPNSERQYEQALRNHVLPTIGKLKISKVREIDVKRIDATIKKHGLSDSTRRSAYNVVRMLFDSAVADRIVKINPAATIARPTDPPKRQPYYSKAEVLRLLDAVKGERIFEHLIPLLLYTGIRAGEALALTWDDVKIDDENAYIVLCATVAPDKQGRVYRQTKTKTKDIRTVPLVSDVVPVLRAAKAARNTDRLAAGEEWQENRLVFAHPSGKLIDDRNLRSRYRTLIRRADLTGSFHALRRSHATLLTGEGVVTVVVSQLLGHSSTAITQQRYTIIGDVMKSDALHKLEDLFREGQ